MKMLLNPTIIHITVEIVKN